MAEEQDNGSRTEQPTDRRLEDSRKRGNVAVSQDVKVWASLVVSALIVVAWLPGAAAISSACSNRSSPHRRRWRSDRRRVSSVSAALLRDVGLVLAPMLAAFVVVAAAACLVQVGLLWAPGKIKPDWGKISPLKGFTRLFSAQALFEFGKGIVKVVVVGAVAAAIGWPIVKALGQVTPSRSRIRSPSSTARPRGCSAARRR